jgi:hypothetical protein
MKNQEILRELLRERVRRALAVHKTKMIEECLKLKLSEKTLYDFISYQRGYVRNSTAQKLYFATKSILG